MELSRKTVGLIIVILSLSLAGLIAVQAYLVRNALAVKHDTLRRNALSALGATARQLEADEYKMRAIQMVALDFGGPINTPIYATAHVASDSTDVTQVMGIWASQSMPGNAFGGRHMVQIEVSDSTSVSMKRPPLGREILRNGTEIHMIKQSLPAGDDTLYTTTDIIRTFDSGAIFQTDQADLVAKIVGDLLRTEQVPINRRIRATQVDSLMTDNLHQVGIDLDFSFAVFGANGTAQMVSDSSATTALANSPYHMALFPLDFTADRSSLVLHFPNSSSYLWRQLMPLTASSAVFTLLIIACFVVTIRTIVSQKRFAEQVVGFINNMTHEFKTPLSTVALATEAMSQPDVLQHKETLIRYNKMISDENQRMQLQVEKILQIAQLERGEIDLNIELVDCHGIIERAIQGLSLQIDHKHGTITRELDAQVPCIKGDTLHLTNIIANLLDNGIKYSSGAPQLTVSTRNESGDLFIAVSDKGIGIGPMDQKRVFTKYFRSTTGDRHDVKGYGLGLSYVKLLMDAHGGAVTLTSRPGAGTTVTLRFPGETNGA
jgi:two-component system, OmpR family, phosphate regulon sensor histidine kinase PhoR